MEALTPAEQEIVDEVYSRFRILDGTAGQKNTVLQKFIGPRTFHCSDGPSMPIAELEALELRANERIYLLGLWKK